MKTNKTTREQRQGVQVEQKCCSSGETTSGPADTEKPGSSKEPADEDTCSATDLSLDGQLEAKAQRKNLSVTNVKSILHHLVKDKRVFKMVQRLAAREGEEEGEGGESGSSRRDSEDWDELTAYEPRLTRSRVREAVMSAVATGNLPTEKLAVVQSVPTSSDVADSSLTVTAACNDTESSDEEYNPDNSSGDEEEEEEEMEEEEGHGMQDAEMVNEEEIKDVDREEGDRVTTKNSSEVPQLHTSTDIAAPCTPTPSNSTQATPTSSLTTPTHTPPRQRAATPVSTAWEENQEIHETALLLASLADTQNTLSPLKFLTQQTAATVAPESSVSGVNRVSGVNIVSGASTDLNSQPCSTAGGTEVPCVSVVQAQPAGDISNHSRTVSGLEQLTEICQFDSYHPDIHAPPTASEEEIAKRTRSKHPLHDVSITSLEAGLGPVEGEDPPIPRELDPDELWWHQWLNSLTTDPLNDSLTSHTVEEEEEEDGEYNFLADCLREEEREEFRNDRAVRIPQREVDDLITELLNPSVEVSGGRLLSSDGVDLTGAYLLETLGVQIPSLTPATVNETPVMASAPQLAPADEPSTPSTSASCTTASSGCVLSQDQTVQVWTQIQQHFQLLMQTFVLARFEPSLVFVSQVAAQALDELSEWCSSSSSGAEGGRGSQCLWYIPDLQDGLNLVKTLDPYDDTAVKISPSTGNPPKVPDGAQQVLMDTMLFWKHPRLLPACGFTPLTTSSASVSKYFTREEECLLVLGMEHYGSSAWQEIQKNLLPTKTIKQLKLRVKNRCSKRTGNNVIKEYKKTKKIPQISDEQMPEVPQWIIMRDKKMTSKEKEEVNKKQKQIDEVRKILCSASRVAASMVSLTPKTDTVLAPCTRTSSSHVSTPCAQSGAVITASTAATLPPGIKRNCSDAETSLPVKRPRVTTPKTRKTRGRKALRHTSTGDTGSTEAENTECTAGGASLEHLLLVAGVESSDPMTKFSFKFLREVKNLVCDSEPSVYHQFIQLLQDHCQHHWRPCELFERVRQLFQPWPYLISLFTEFLSPQDCLEANVLQENQDVQNVKSFLSKLQAQFSSSPLQLKEITDRLRQLDTPSVTRQQVCDALLPLMEVHYDLSEELRRFIFHLAPPPRNGECYEEITLRDDTHPMQDTDGFEQVTLLGSANASNEGPT